MPKMTPNSTFRKNKNLIGFLILPVIPVMVYLVDAAILGSLLSEYIHELYKSAGFLAGHRPHNFYNFDYNRTVFSITMAIAPLAILHWYHCADASRFDFSIGWKWQIGVALFPIGFALMWILILFLPLSDNENPTRKTLSLYRLHRNPLAFTIMIYPMFYMAFMLLGLCLRYLCHLFKDKT